MTEIPTSPVMKLKRKLWPSAIVDPALVPGDPVRLVTVSQESGARLGAASRLDTFLHTS